MTEPIQPDPTTCQPPATPPFTCPVIAVAQQALTSARALTRTLRHLRTFMRRCSECDMRFDCPMREDFNSQLTIALQEVVLEWDLT